MGMKKNEAGGQVASHEPHFVALRVGGVPSEDVASQRRPDGGQRRLCTSGRRALWVAGSVRAEALTRSAPGVPCRSRWPVPQEDSGRGVPVGHVSGDPASHSTDALQAVLFSV